MSSQVETAPLAVVDPQSSSPDLTACDREPIHISGAIQPHGLLLIADLASLRVVAGAGQIEDRLRADWLDQPLADLLGEPVEAALLQAQTIGRSIASVGVVRGRTESFDALLHISDDHVLVELEPRPDMPVAAVATLSRLDAFSTNFERAPDLISLCERAALAYRELTGFDRVMVYRFLDDGAGMVLAEERDPQLPSFLNHHFPASDIPQQARALYVRNRVRVIPDVGYEPAAIRPSAAGLGAIDLSDASLRSVSPIHIQYLKNMGVQASASISIVKDGLLWGLIACHNHQPRRIGYEARIACQALAGGLARQIRAKEEAQIYRERLRLRSGEEKLVGRLTTERPGVDWFVGYGDEFSRLFNADGFAVVRDQQVSTSGAAPDADQILALAAWIRTKGLTEPFVSMALSEQFAPAAAYTRMASGVLAINLTGESDALLLWFRVEHLETVEWAGNPHKDAQGEAGILTPRSSFAGWREEVRGRSRRWTIGEIEAASRLRRTLTSVRQSQRLRELNRQLGLTIAEKEALLAEKDHLLREVNHRVQNSLQLVQAFLALQANSTNDATLIDHLGEAQRRLSAVALVHRRLYQADQLETVDLSRYLEELIGDMISASGAEWGAQIRLDLAPVLISADRAVHVGLILTELVINANKYAYGGKPGPMAIAIEEHGGKFRLIVADNGTGKVRTRVGFGTRMIEAMVQSLGGTLEQSDNQPGLRVIVTAPIDKI
ncbi:histidine kinase dimerization/phosphoacceptor domain -containing protein [Sphingomonas sp.]|uniref:histidine kinase dimerization/phosphoacceptor domain -containing protein n=1 Tax=Sphingomonas sp. TaxID=28214 RepID=UPI003B3BB1BD